MNKEITKDNLERSIRYLRDNSGEKVIFYSYTRKIDVISKAVSICNDLRVPYELYSKCIKINGGVLEFAD